MLWQVTHQHEQILYLSFGIDSVGHFVRQVVIWARLRQPVE